MGTSDDLNELQVRDAPPKLEESVWLAIDELKQVNLGMIDEFFPTYMSNLLCATKINDLFLLPLEFIDYFF